MYTFVNIYDALAEIASNHKQINTFGFGDLWEFQTSGTTDYPVLFAIPDGATAAKGEVGNKLKLLVMDRVLKGERNEVDVLSDTQQILLDVITELKDNSRDIHLRHDKIPMEYFTERFDDEVAGWSADVILWVSYPADRCAIPNN